MLYHVILAFPLSGRGCREDIIQRPKHKLGVLDIYGVAFSTVPRCPVIYLATLLFSVIIVIVIVGVSLGVGIAWMSAVTFVPFFINPFAGLRFFFGITLGLAVLWAAILGLMAVLLKAGQAGMFLRLHQGYRPGLADFGSGVVRYTWRFLKGYFHIALLYAVPLIILLGWLILHYASYSSLIFESRLNYGLRVDFFRSIHAAFNFVLALMALIYCVLLLWDESVVLEGSTFQDGFLRSIRFTIRNPLRLIAVAIINFLVVLLVTVLTTVAPIPPLSVGVIDFVREAFTGGLPTFWYNILMFILMPILSYTHFLLYIPNRPFGIHAVRIRRRPDVLEITEEDEIEELADIISLGPREPVPRGIVNTRGDKEDRLIDRRKERRRDTIVDKDEEPDDDFLHLN